MRHRRLDGSANRRVLREAMTPHWRLRMSQKKFCRAPLNPSAIFATNRANDFAISAQAVRPVLERRDRLFVRIKSHRGGIVPIAITTAIWNQLGHAAAIGEFDDTQGHHLQRPLVGTAARLPNMRSLRRDRG